MLAPASRLSRIWSTSMASASRTCTEELVAFAPWIAMSLARRSWPSWDCSSVSMVPSQPRPSWALRLYCACSAIEARIRIAEVVSVGESEGRLSTRPVLSCSWVLASRESPVCSASCDRFIIMFCVTREIVIAAAPSC